ncbi:hypothetical protein GCM10022408_23950 [Hymenobacter fastidiosus]|uniref:DUF1905 domain-containing protein n=1 Tax=Hymenobacter fastidiosus TaxID=486264 RepID=A0ABP7SF06_9BACT
MSDSSEQRFDATLELDSTDGGVLVVIPFDVPAAFAPQRAPFHVRGTIDGFPFRLTLVQNKEGEYVLPVNKQLRNTINKSWTSDVQLVIGLDTDEGTLELPEELERALRTAGTRSKFDALAYPYRREYVQWIERAKKPETRMRRVQEAVELIANGKKLS